MGKTARFPLGSFRFDLVMVVVHVVMFVAVIAATPSHFLKLVAPLFGLPAVLTMLLYCIAELVFRPMNVSFTLILRPCWQ